MAGPAILAGFWLWGKLDSIANKNVWYEPITKTEGEPAFTPSRDVSVICCLLQPEPKFLKCLEGWLRNNPLEVILVTTEPYYEAVQGYVQLLSFDTSKVRIFQAPKEPGGFRGQLAHGLRQARGKIIAKVDGQIEWPDDYLVHMLPCFEDEEIGSAGGNIFAYISKECQHPDRVTPWQVAGAKVAWNGGASSKSIAYTATKFRWILAGGSVLYRTSIVTSEEFLYAFLNDVWHGPFGGRTRLDAGEDTFISRWMSGKGYINAWQAMPQTDVLRVPKQTFRAWVMQMVRWERSTIQSFLRSVWETPQVRQSPYILRLTLERALKGPLAVIHLWAWWASLKQWPLCTLALLAYYLWRMVPGYRAFFDSYPFMRRHWWAAVLADHICTLLQPWIWLTLGVDEWYTGESVTKKVEQPFGDLAP